MDSTPIIIKKKKAHGDHGHHGGSWKVAYADFVTAMMAFFMVMWIMGLSDETRAQIQGYFNDPIGFVKNQPRTKTVIAIKGSPNNKPGQTPKRQNDPLDDEHSAVQKLKEKITKVLKGSAEFKALLQHMDLQLTGDGLRIEFLENDAQFFERGSAELRPAARKLIDALGPQLAKSKRVMKIEGHTDSTTNASDANFNFRLSMARAMALQDELSKTGVTQNQFDGISGLGDKYPRDATHPESGVNRRVSILLPYAKISPDAKIEMPKDELRHTLGDQFDVSVKVKPQPPRIGATKK